jgi:hypothetical protein
VCHASLTAPFWAQYALSEIHASVPSFATYTHVGVLKMPLPHEDAVGAKPHDGVAYFKYVLSSRRKGDMFINCSKV